MLVAERAARSYEQGVEQRGQPEGWPFCFKLI